MFVKNSIGETSEIFNEVEPLNGKLKKLEIAHERHVKVSHSLKFGIHNLTL